MSINVHVCICACGCVYAWVLLSVTNLSCCGPDMSPLASPWLWVSNGFHGPVKHAMPSSPYLLALGGSPPVLDVTQCFSDVMLHQAIP